MTSKNQAKALDELRGLFVDIVANVTGIPRDKIEIDLKIFETGTLFNEAIEAGWVAEEEEETMWMTSHQAQPTRAGSVLVYGVHLADEDE